MNFLDYIRLLVGVTLGGIITYFYQQYYPEADLIYLIGMFIISSVAASAVLYYGGKGSG